MKVIMSMAISVNGMIADENGSEDFLSHQNWVQFSKLAIKFGNNVWGRKTYEAVKQWPKEYLADLKNVVKVIISRNEALKIDPEFIRVSSPQEAIQYLSDQGFNEVLVTGGSSIYSAYLQANLVDEIIFDIEPVILGKGIPAFILNNHLTKMQLLGVNQIVNGLIEIHYKVVR